MIKDGTAVAQLTPWNRIPWMKISYCWSANLYILASDMFPKGAVASVVGIAGLSGAIGDMLVATFAGWVLHATWEGGRRA
jgi:hypothetical protein